jgi:hypothetical protein
MFAAQLLTRKSLPLSNALPTSSLLVTRITHQRAWNQTFVHKGFALSRMAFSRLVRFVPKSDPSAVLIGEPVNSSQNVGLATRNGEKVEVKVFSGKSALDPGSATEQIETVEHLLSPLAQEEVGTIRCIGLNVSWLAREEHQVNWIG